MRKINSVNDFKNPFFIGIAGSGMSAIAQYLVGIKKTVSGSDRYFQPGVLNDTENKLCKAGIQCFLQNGEGITGETDLVVVSTAVEDTVEEVQKAKHLNIPIIKRSELLALIAESRKTIAIGGTSGKSTTTAMLFDILQHGGLDPGIITGAGLTRLIKQNKIGNAWMGNGDWLIIEADESDGSIVQYKPETGVLLNIDKDHKEVDELLKIFKTFRVNSKRFIVNQSNILAKQFSQNINYDFSTDENAVGYKATHINQSGLTVYFVVNDTNFVINTPGKHNVENAVAAIAVANQLGVSLNVCAEALKEYEGIYRRHEVKGQKNGVWLIDDYAHNPAKCAASIRACQPLAKKLIAWFQPHGYGPTSFLRNEFVAEIANALRPTDEIWMSEIFYAGGTAEKNISSKDLIHDIKALNKNAYFIENRKDFLQSARSHITADCVILLMGARDPGLKEFADDVWEQL